MSMRYPDEPGFKAGANSRAAADAIAGRAPNLRERVFSAIEAAPGGLTADEIAEKIGATPFAVRPRVTELSAKGRIFDTGNSRLNASGRSASVWAVWTVGPVSLPCFTDVDDDLLGD